jgi:hypothetical protein
MNIQSCAKILKHKKIFCHFKICTTVFKISLTLEDKFTIVKDYAKQLDHMNFSDFILYFKPTHFFSDYYFHLCRLGRYRAIKLICNRIIHGFESVCLLR